MNKKIIQTKGFSLIENLVYLGILGIVLSIFMSLTANTMRSSTVAINAKEVQQDGRFILSRIDQELKTAQDIISVASDKVTFTDNEGRTAYIEWDSVAKAVYYNNGTDNYKISNKDIEISQMNFSLDNNMVRTDITVKKEYSVSGNDAEYGITTSSVVIPRQDIY